MSIASGYGPNWTTAEGRAVDLQRRVVELEQQLAAAQAEAREWQRVATEQAQLHADDTSRLEAEARELRAELALVRELAAKWRAAPQNPDEPLLAMAADELEAALSRPAERESRPLTFTQGVLCSLSILDGYGDSIAYREVANPHDLNQLWEEADEFDREHLARHGFCPVPAAQESDAARPTEQEG